MRLETRVKRAKIKDVRLEVCSGFVCSAWDPRTQTVTAHDKGVFV